MMLSVLLALVRKQISLLEYYSGFKTLHESHYEDEVPLNNFCN